MENWRLETGHATLGLRRLTATMNDIYYSPPSAQNACNLGREQGTIAPEHGVVRHMLSAHMLLVAERKVFACHLILLLSALGLPGFR